MDNRSLYTPLKEEGLTTLKIRYDWRTGRDFMYAAKEWDPDIKWSDYNRKFYQESLLTNNDIRLNDKETRELFKKYGLEDYLNEVLDLLRGGRYFGLDCLYNSQKDWRFTANIHTYIMGMQNFEQCIYTGGIRRHEPDEPEIDVLVDGLNLARAETHKHIAAGLHYGGGKITVQAEQVDLENKDELGFLAFALDRVRFFTGPDMRYPVELADALHEYTRYINGGLKSNPIGPSGDPTAWGVENALREAVKFKFGQDDLSGLKVAVMGLGAVGFPQAKYLLEDNAELIVSDLDHSRIDELRKLYPDRNIEETDDILNVEADILCPCAIGGFLDEKAIDGLKVKMVFGAANNQLAAKTIEEEIELSKRLADRGILYEECWVHNIGGVMSGAEMHMYEDKADKKSLMDKVAVKCAEMTRTNLREAEERGVTPTQNAYDSVEARIYGE
jgi:leucine dehydrogenase